MYRGQGRVGAAGFDPAEVGPEQLGLVGQVLLGHPFGIPELFEAQTELALDEVVVVSFHDNRYRICALIHTHTNSYISV